MFAQKRIWQLDGGIMSFPRTNTGNLSKRELKSDDKPLPFRQPSPSVTSAGGHPHRNLGHYLHAPKGQSKQTLKKAPFPKGRPFDPQNNPDYKPKAANGSSKFAKGKTVAGQNQGQSDINSEAIGSSMGSVAPGEKQKDYKTRPVKAKQMPFYG